MVEGVLVDQPHITFTGALRGPKALRLGVYRAIEWLRDKIMEE